MLFYTVQFTTEKSFESESRTIVYLFVNTLDKIFDEIFQYADLKKNECPF